MSGAVEYRVVSKRAGMRPVVRRFATARGAEHRLTLLGPEPWKAFGKEPDDFDCCDGRECFCEGLTVREMTERKRAEMPALEYVRLEVREVGKWEPSRRCPECGA